jgi:putative zinc finger/helix-turn-helix YgiT family protein
MFCPACGRQPSHTVEQYQYRESGLDNVFVRGVGIDRCKCGQEYVQLPGAQEVHDQMASVLLNKSSLLTGPEAKFLRKWLRLTSEEMAKVLGYTRVSVSRWEKHGPSVATDRVLRLYASAVRNVSIDFVNLFSSMNDKPQRNFRIVVDGLTTAPQYSVDVAKVISTVDVIRAFPQFTVDVAQAASTIVTSGGSIPKVLFSFESAISVVDATVHAANQELAQAA